MSRPAINSEVLQFLDQHVHSIRQLELLLLICSSAHAWSVKEAAKALYSSQNSTQAWLEEFKLQGVLTCDADSKYLYHPETSAFKKVISQLAEEYKVRPLKVVEAILNRSTNQMMSFLHAFQIKKEGSDDNS